MKTIVIDKINLRYMTLTNMANNNWIFLFMGKYVYMAIFKTCLSVEK